MTRLKVGDIVQDKEKPDNDKGIVILTIDGTLEDWTITEDEETGEEITIADDQSNEDYEVDQRPVIISWLDDVEDKLKWKNISPSRMFDTVSSAGIKFYGFPENRLEKVDENE